MMEQKIDFFDKTFRRDVYQNLIDEQETKALLETLVRMQKEQGIDQQEAETTAHMCLAAVVSCESIRSAVVDNAQSVVDELLAQVEDSWDSELTLHKLYFGITEYQQHVATGEQKGAEELFWQYYNKNKDTKSVAELKEDIRNALKDYRLNPEMIQAMTNAMTASGDYLAVATALGEGGISFKCITAMEVYLNNRDTMTIHEAANIACTAVEVQATADAVGRGLITRKTAKKLLIIAGIVLAVVALALAIHYGGIAMALAEKAASTLMMPLAPVFAEFAIHTAKDGTAWTPAPFTRHIPESVIKAAKSKEILASFVMALGVAGVALSKKTSDLIGKFRAGFTVEKDRITQGLQAVVEPVQNQADVETEQHAAEEEIFEEQPAKLNAT